MRPSEGTNTFTIRRALVSGLTLAELRWLFTNLTVGRCRCRLTVSKPVLKAPVVSALEPII
jgi:hypothetical protein